MSRQLLNILILIATTAFVMVACKKSDKPNFHFEYFAMEPGRFVIYDVTEIQHDVNATIKHDVTTYQLKTVWGEEYVDNQGREGRLFRRYVRNTAADQWVLKDVWSGLIDGVRAELVEENQRRVKLVFSPSVTKEWDANAYNMDAELNCYYTAIHDVYNVPSGEIDSTVTIEQGYKEPTAIDTFTMYEVYAKNIGLIHKVERDVYYGFAQPEIQSGHELFYTYVASGKE